MSDPTQIVDASFREGNLGDSMLSDFRYVYNEYRTEVVKNHAVLFQKNSNGHPPDEEEVRTAAALLHSIAATAALNLLMDTLLNTVCNHFGVTDGDDRMVLIREHSSEAAKRINDFVMEYLEEEGVPVVRIDDRDNPV